MSAADEAGVPLRPGDTAVSSERGGGASAPSPHRFSPAVRGYLERHAVDVDLAHAARRPLGP